MFPFFATPFSKSNRIMNSLILNITGAEENIFFTGMSTLQVAVPRSNSEFSVLITQQMKACGERVVAKPAEATKPLASQEAKLRIPGVCSQLHIIALEKKANLEKLLKGNLISHRKEQEKLENFSGRVRSFILTMPRKGCSGTVIPVPFSIIILVCM